ncbi:non-canonical purine NTP pyrophosphatase [Patescibacteria group bacterium]|nr:non-canonical purine NTP pyrophosphatase [Patescibacteria group bacterium]MBU2220186.1 non-canonical purine NTP pyrophosphatase [Patescibacteria group bacterium]MBU2265284.1 non-canonical purine NTP pyrophosphatase [Patescibacteria group bacterium]
MKPIFFITGNNFKFQVAKKALAGIGVELIQKELDTPEIQSVSVEEVASFSAKWASDLLKEAVIVSDAGYYIEALNGFPGPFIKYINEWLSADDILRLMAGKENREVTVKDCLAYCEPGKKPVIFCDSAKGAIANKKGGKGRTSINEIFVPEGYDKVESDIPWDEMKEFWAKNLKHYKLLAEYLKKK